MTERAVEINRPDVLAEVLSAYRRYEAALLTADVAALDELFWSDVRTIRYGVAEILHGHAAIAAYNARRKINPERVLADTVVTTYGADFGTASTLFIDTPEGTIGRQMQSWARMPEGWRLVAAHVSVIKKPTEP
jgi:Protein of unknown function (DUF3225)